MSHNARDILNKYASLFLACYSVFPRNLLKDLLNRDGEMCVVLIFDICNVYEIFAVLRPRKNGRYGFEISRKHQRLTFVFILLARLIWFCEAAKTKSVYFPNFKRMTCYQSYLHWCRGAKQTFRNTFSSVLDLPKIKKNPRWGLG